ncbi:immunity 70 family protein [Campylobacter jejuni]|nr:hypothetical protein [Campylobacter jejuni]EAI7204423.1 hypothetical protein [Campylobacter jejuni]EAK3736086.1 hypothetical protein [Campylobacter jejuni]EAL1722472.1 hypothetical protein [Campylobacter jejuni]EBF5431689.1 hypothetical protein [Campylobacter jejuni]
MVGFNINNLWYEIGNGDFLHAFFSNVAYHLEKGNWGSRFPILMNEVYQGELNFSQASLALNELENIQKEFKNFTPKQIIWDIENLSLMPPWGDNISSDITNLSNYFITSDGNDFIELFKKVLQLAENEKVNLTIKSF